MRPLEFDPSVLFGFEVIARYGHLGFVVDPRNEGHDADPDHVLVRGGLSGALYYQLPVSYITRISPTRLVIEVAVDVGDFVPQLCADGTVDLMPEQHPAAGATGGGA